MTKIPSEVFHVQETAGERVDLCVKKNFRRSSRLKKTFKGSFKKTKSLGGLLYRNGP